MKLIEVEVEGYKNSYFLVSSIQMAKKYFRDGFRKAGYVNIYPDSCCSSLYRDANSRNYYRRISRGLYTEE